MLKWCFESSFVISWVILELWPKYIFINGQREWISCTSQWHAGSLEMKNNE